MRIGDKLKCGGLAVAGIALFFVPSASASMIGLLDVANCGGTPGNGGGVNVTLLAVDWLLPTGGPDGCVVTGTNTSIQYGPGFADNVGASVAGRIKDLPGPGSGFMTFIDPMTLATLTFDLAGIGPGVNSIACVNSFNPNDPACSVFAGSAFILAPTSTGTTVTFNVFGLAHDSLTPADAGNRWLGSFTTQVAGQTPAELQATILGGGTVHSTFSGEFLVVIPEPISMALIGGGLIGLALMRRRRLHA